VDEYQDTNLAQYAIARGLSVDHPNLCATGDPDQSIYSWRGADVQNILSFEKDFPGAKVVRLERNYRSTGRILATADHLIRRNERRKHKDLVTDNPPGELVPVYCHQNEASEAGFAADEIQRAVAEGKRRYRDHAVFVRTGALTRPLEAALRQRGVPFQVFGGFAFFERREIRDLVAYTRLILNPLDDAAFVRAVNSPPRGVGDTSLQRLAAYAAEFSLSLLEACRRPRAVPGLKGKPAVALEAFFQLIDGLTPLASSPPADALLAILDRTGFLASLESDDEDEDRVNNVLDVVAAAKDFQNADATADLTSFLEAVSLLGDADRRDDKSDVVTVMTLHAAKGLEFPVVYLTAFEESILPHVRSVEKKDVEEERRLAFVGITRARERLVISYTRRRNHQGKVLYPGPSPFLDELDPAALDRRDLVDNDVGSHESRFDEVKQDPGWEEPFIRIVRRSAEPSPADRFVRGMLVHHPKYGNGQIVQLDGVGVDRKATVQFPSVGSKRFMLSKAPLEPL
ncbi:MAG: ATP-dependent helicase, partial [Planctomycetia bacterium]